MTDHPMRDLEFTTEVAAPVEAVWDSITTGDGLASWYVARAEVDRALGGEVTLSWGEGPPGVARIDVWEPPTRVRFAYVPQGGMEVGGLGGGSEEWLLSHEGGITSVRLTHSLPDPGVEDWGDYYGDIRRGWTLFLATMRHYLENTNRRGRVTTLAVPQVTGSPEAAWKRLIAELGLGLAEADATTTAVVDGETHPARVLVSIEPMSLLVAIADTLLLADIEGSAEQRVFYALASTFGDDNPDASERRAALVAAVTRAAG